MLLHSVSPLCKPKKSNTFQLLYNLLHSTLFRLHHLLYSLTIKIICYKIANEGRCVSKGKMLSAVYSVWPR